MSEAESKVDKINIAMKGKSSSSVNDIFENNQI